MSTPKSFWENEIFEHTVQWHLWLNIIVLIVYFGFWLKMLLLKRYCERIESWNLSVGKKKRKVPPALQSPFRSNLALLSPIFLVWLVLKVQALTTDAWELRNNKCFKFALIFQIQWKILQKAEFLPWILCSLKILVYSVSLNIRKCLTIFSSCGMRGSVISQFLCMSCVTLGIQFIICQSQFIYQ